MRGFGIWFKQDSRCSICGCLSITPIHDSQGRLTHYFGIQSDITELVQQRQAELAARHAAMQVHLGVCVGRGGGIGGRVRGLTVQHSHRALALQRDLGLLVKREAKSVL